MKHILKTAVLLIAASLLTLNGCRKDDSISSNTNSDLSMARGTHAREFSSEVAQDWMKMEMTILRTITGLNNLYAVRPFVYSGIAMYQSVVPGMPSYQTLSGQLTGLPAMPGVTPNLTYYWPESMNAAMSKFYKLMLPTMGAANLASVDSLEAAYRARYATATDASTLERSEAYGRDVAQAIYNWSTTDGNAHLADPYTVPTGPGMWVPTPPAFAATPLGAHWGDLRVMVAGSGNNALPPPPPAYSETPGSEFYNMAQQVYDVSQNLTQAQIDQAMYYRDVPGYTTAGHYLSLLLQVLAQEDADLETAASSYALIAIVTFDESISTWQSKYTYNLIRPVSYIRTVLGHPTWSPLLTTPNHPEYSSAHASLSAGVGASLASIFGDNYTITDHTYDYLGFPPRTFNSFTAFGEDAGNSRLYAGIHYQNSIDKALIQGRVVAQNILNTLVLKKP